MPLWRRSGGRLMTSPGGVMRSPPSRSPKGRPSHTKPCAAVRNRSCGSSRRWAPDCGNTVRSPRPAIRIPGPGRPLTGLLFSLLFLAGPALVLWGVLVNPSVGGLVFVVIYSVVHGGIAAAFFSDQYGRAVTVDSKTYALAGAGEEFTWVDYYASGDIVANGPVVDSTSEPPAPGWPHEVEVHNRGSWFSDHKSYLANVEEFLGDLVPRLIGLGSDDAPRNTGQAAAAARRYWRVKWLVAARVLVVATATALLLRLYVHRTVIGARVIDFIPVPVRKLGTLAAKPFADLPIPGLSAPVVGVLSIALAGWVTYAILKLVWRRWDRRDSEIFFSGKEYDAGGVPFGVFLAGVAVVAAAAVGAVLSVWFNADLLGAVFDTMPSLPKPLLTLGVMAFSAGALYRGTAGTESERSPGSIVAPRRGPCYWCRNKPCGAELFLAGRWACTHAARGTGAHRGGRCRGAGAR